MKFKWKTFWYSLALTFLFAIGGGIATYAGMPQYEAAEHPFLTPPSWLFPVVWSILFLLMAYSAAVIYDSGSHHMPKAIFVYALQLTMNFWWCVLFFGWEGGGRQAYGYCASLGHHHPDERHHTDILSAVADLCGIPELWRVPAEPLKKTVTFFYQNVTVSCFASVFSALKNGGMLSLRRQSDFTLCITS